MKILKFGGSVLRGSDGFAKMVPILKECKEETIVVISAFSTTTQQLVDASILASQGEITQANESLDLLVESFLFTIEELIENSAKRSNIVSMIELGKKEVQNFLEGLSITKELTERTLDAVMSFGEFFSLHIVTHFLREQGVQLESIDARQFLITNEEYGNASPIRSETKERLHSVVLPALQRSNIVITQGFIGRTQSGETTTLGKESSNTTATLLASLLHANEVIIYTNVDGIRSADPKRIPNTKVLPLLTYKDASIMAHEGVKILHLTTIEQLIGTTIPLTIRSLFSANGESTIIQSEIPETSQEPIKGAKVVIEHKNVFKLQVQSNTNFSMQRYVGFQIVHQEHHNDNDTYYLLQTGAVDASFVQKTSLETLSGVSILSTTPFDASTLRKVIRTLSQTQLHLFSIQQNLIFAVFNNSSNVDVVQTIHDSIL
jgi:aspartate kinase